MNTTAGVLYGVGLGPGDPELVTVKAARLIGAAGVVAYHSARHGRSIARSIAAPYLRGDQIEEQLVYPVTTEPAQHPGGYEAAIEEFYEQAAARLMAHLAAGRDVVLLAEGDPLFYSSYMHMHKRISRRFRTEIVPGITSVSAASAALATPLVEGDDVLTVLPGTLGRDELTRRLSGTGAAAIMKISRSYADVLQALKESGRLPQAYYVERASGGAQQLIEPAGDVDPSAVPYMSIIIVPGAEAAGQPADQARTGRADRPGQATAQATEQATGRVDVVGLGPAGRDWLTPQAMAVLAAADDIVGYGPYVDRVPPNPRQQRHGSDNRVEAQRAEFALDLARQGRRVAVVSSGDPGVFAMASVVLEAAASHERFADVPVDDRARDHRRAGRGEPGRRPAGPRLRRLVPVGSPQALGGHRPAARGGGGRRLRDRHLQPGVRLAAPATYRRAQPAAGPPGPADPGGGRPRRRHARPAGHRDHARRSRPRAGRHAVPAHRRLQPDPRPAQRNAGPQGDHPPPLPRLSHRTVSATVVTTTVPSGSGGRSTMTTRTPREAAASSLASVIGPPLFLVTSSPTPWLRISADSPSTVYGPRSSTSVMRGGTAPSGGSTVRTRKRCRSSAAKTSRSRRPVVRNTDSPGQGRTAAAAPRMSGTRSQEGAAAHSGRRRTSSGTPARAVACAAWAVISPANGWVASMTPVIRSARRNAARPSTPPNPPTRTGPSGSRGCRTRPASDESTSTPPATSSAASARASPVPPRIRIRTRLRVVRHTGQMRELLVVGMGPGHPDQITVQAVQALNRSDVFFRIDKGDAKSGLNAVRDEILRRHVTRPGYRVVEIPEPPRDRSPDLTAAGYQGAVRDWHEARAELIEAAIAAELGDDGVGAFLVWGDPSVYDSTLRIIDRLLARGAVAFTYTVIPGVTSVQALAAAHRVPLNRIGEPIHITPARRIAGGLPAGLDSAVVMLDSGFTAAGLDEEELTVFWGAYLSTPDETLIRGPLAEVAGQITAARAELRTRHGWIMDTYLLRRNRDRDEAE